MFGWFRKTEKMYATIEQGKQGRWRFIVKDAGGNQIVPHPIEGYDTPDAAIDVLDRMQDAEIKVTIE